MAGTQFSVNNYAKNVNGVIMTNGNGNGLFFVVMYQLQNDLKLLLAPSLS